MPEEFEVLKLVCNRLDSAQIPYMLTGSFASHFYAVPRMTRDIDIVVEILKPELHQFIRLFKDDFYLVSNSIMEAIENEGMFNIIHNTSIFKVDFIIRKDSSYRCVEFQRRRKLKLGDLESWVVSPEDLILSKLFWAKDSLSDLQLRDVKNLLSANKTLDHEYMLQWVQKLELSDVWGRIVTNG